jgi:hypothetical protein
MHGDNVRKAIKKAQHGNEVRKGVNEYRKTAWNSWMHTKDFPMENAMKTDKPTKYIPKAGETNGEKPGEHIRYVINKVDEKNAHAQGANDHAKSTGGKPKRNQNVNPLGGKAKGHKGGVSPLKHRYGAGMGGGSEPSGTNTYMDKDKFTRRKDGSMPNC